MQYMFYIIFFLAFALRIFNLGQVPPSLYWDEASLGYNAYSIATTLHDEHGEFLPIQRFIAFGDYKPPGYIYAAAASVKLFGLSEFSIRLPSALAGTLLVLVTYYLVKMLKPVQHDKAALIAALLVAISPWSLQMSRGAFEGNLATLFSGLGILFFIKAINHKKLFYFIFSSIFLILSMYTFNSHRVFVPLITIGLSLIYAKDLLSQKRNFLLFLISCFLFLLPLFPYFLTRESGLRFQEVSWANDLAPIELSNDRIAADDNILANIIHNRRVVWAGEFLKHYTDHFKPDFLFFTGDINERLSTRNVGELYLIELPFLLAGLYYLIKQRNKVSAVILAWLLLAPIPAALARETPHALRSLNILPIPQIIIAVGLVKLLNLKLLKYLVITLYLVSCILYLRDYYLEYPTRSAASWQYGYKEMVREVSRLEGQYPCVSVTEAAGRPYIYFLLYNKYSPEKYWATKNISRDWFGFWTVHSFDKYYFRSNPGNCLRVDYVDNKFTFSGI